MSKPIDPTLLYDTNICSTDHYRLDKLYKLYSTNICSIDHYKQ